jgi:hypothetical protein
VAEQPHGAYHFETGRALAERLGYPADLLDRTPGEAMESFAGSATSSTCRSSPGRAGDGSGQRLRDDTFVAATLARLRRSQHEWGQRPPAAPCGSSWRSRWSRSCLAAWRHCGPPLASACGSRVRSDPTTLSPGRLARGSGRSWRPAGSRWAGERETVLPVPPLGLPPAGETPGACSPTTPPGCSQRVRSAPCPGLALPPSDAP